jgi:hypothetical protein
VCSRSRLGRAVISYTLQPGSISYMGPGGNVDVHLACLSEAAYTALFTQAPRRLCPTVVMVHIYYTYLSPLRVVKHCCHTVFRARNRVSSISLNSLVTMRPCNATSWLPSCGGLGECVVGVDSDGQSSTTHCNQDPSRI